MLTSSTFVGGFWWTAHWLYPVNLFNAAPQRSGLVKHPDVPMHSPRTSPPQPSSEEEDWWRRLVKMRLVIARKPAPFKGRVPDDYLQLDEAENTK